MGKAPWGEGIVMGGEKQGKELVGWGGERIWENGWCRGGASTAAIRPGVSDRSVRRMRSAVRTLRRRWPMRLAAMERGKGREGRMGG